MKFTAWSLASAASLLAARADGAILWDGRFNDPNTAADIDQWSFSNPVGDYQYYIHGSGPRTEYVNLSPDFKNPADAGSKQGAKISLTSTSFWNGQTMRRTELIPQTKAAIATGKRFYHFSLMRSDTNAPSLNKEHQIAFFESHFTELKSGWQSGEAGTSDPLLRWDVSGKTQWNVTWDAAVWHNVAYEIDFGAGTVGFWHSTGADPLTQVVAPISAPAQSNGADWHVGVLELPRDGFPDTDEDLFFSGVYIEDGELTTKIGSGSGSGSTAPASSAVPAAPAAPVSSQKPSSPAPPAASQKPSAPVASAPAASAPAVNPPAAAPASSVPAASPSTKPTCRRRRRRSQQQRK